MLLALKLHLIVGELWACFGLVCSPQMRSALFDDQRSTVWLAIVGIIVLWPLILFRVWKP